MFHRVRPRGRGRRAHTHRAGAHAGRSAPAPCGPQPWPLPPLPTLPRRLAAAPIAAAKLEPRPVAVSPPRTRRADPARAGGSRTPRHPALDAPCCGAVQPHPAEDCPTAGRPPPCRLPAVHLAGALGLRPGRTAARTPTCGEGFGASGSQGKGGWSLDRVPCRVRAFWLRVRDRGFTSPRASAEPSLACCTRGSPVGQRHARLAAQARACVGGLPSSSSTCQARQERHVPPRSRSTPPSHAERRACRPNKPLWHAVHGRAGAVFGSLPSTLGRPAPHPTTDLRVRKAAFWVTSRRVLPANAPAEVDVAASVLADCARNYRRPPGSSGPLMIDGGIHRTLPCVTPFRPRSSARLGLQRGAARPGVGWRTALRTCTLGV
jgi:hypothetical protein